MKEQYLKCVSCKKKYKRLPQSKEMHCPKCLAQIKEIEKSTDYWR